MPLAKTQIASLQEILVTRSRATFPYRINFNNITKAQIEEMAVWCINNCQGLWREEEFMPYMHSHLQFENDYDATMFMLKFGSRGNV